MKFHTIAIPHKDILEGRLTMDVFAADLWEVVQGRAPQEYANPEIFFNKTFITQGLTNLLGIAEKRLMGKGGEPIIQLQTPFGGGKTHSLISLYHKSKDWNAKAVAIVGTTFDPKDTTLWAEVERQLKGKVNKLKGDTAPGRDKIRDVIELNLPVLILMDEVLEYFTKASGIKVGDSTLAAQSLAFMQELTEAVKTVEKALLVLTLPSSVIEHYGEESERLFQQLQKVSGRVEKVYTPVSDEEIVNVINTRLFSNRDTKKALRIIDVFLDYIEQEKILPIGMEKSEYRERFIKSYPFQPEVIDILYKKWGSFTTFQRTRGVLRLLSLVVYFLRSSSLPFISLSDFSLERDEIRRELLKHIGQEFDSIVASDITAKDSGAKKVDLTLGDAYQGLSLGSKVATTLFLYSHSGGVEKGAILNELKRCCADSGSPSSVIVEIVEKLRNMLFYLQAQNEPYYFTNQPNINKVLLTKMENIRSDELREEERKLLRNHIGNRFLPYIWTQRTKDIPDTEKLKLIVLPSDERDRGEMFLREYGERPRINTNTLLFLVPLHYERASFENTLRKKIAYRLIEKDKTLNLNEDQIRDIKTNIKNAEKTEKEHIRNLYRIILVPSKDNLKEHDIGISTYGADRKIDEEIYENLRNAGDILEGLSPLIIKEKYLKENDYVEVHKIYESSLKTRGELRFTSKNVLKESIREGVSKGLFGFGELSDGKVVCRYYKEIPPVEVIENEILIKEELCMKEEVKEESQVKEPEIEETKEVEESDITVPQGEKAYSKIHFELRIPKGRFSDVVRTLNYLQTKFDDINISVDITAKDGKLAEADYEDRVKEGLRQANIEIEKEEKS